MLTDRFQPIFSDVFGETVPRFEKVGRGGFMRRYLTLVCLLCLAIPAGISISGCIRNPAGNYCNGLGYGLKNTDVYSIDLEPQTTGISHGLRADAPDCGAHGQDLQRRSGQRGSLYVRHHQQPAGRHLAVREHLRRHMEPQFRRRHRRLHHLQLPQPAAQHNRAALRDGVHITPRRSR